MRERGFKNVYQLDGGIINYAQTFPEGSFEGECFVFDERMSMAFTDNPEKLGVCHFCDAPTNSYHNCANPECNDLILECAECLESGRRLCQVCEGRLLKVS